MLQSVLFLEIKSAYSNDATRMQRLWNTMIISFYIKEYPMATSILICTESECQQKRAQLETLSYEALFRQLDKCEHCENGIFKENSVAADTYQAVALYWAQIHNMSVGHSSLR